ncbi:MAG: acetylornithine/succinylornithine family transaminase [Actinobacteria bacterium]|jgi:acetylornithine/N-succinyldiaminopimelate aminotransferase|nr:acetylornithine/succinylornithine family transaminase [Actinomycetota bacterium]NCV97094.1 acetylornithine/succinylornithine family transaminase [Acidimicrobiia bacterium]NBS36710.1 acetylornithine/succinylornithine family transaminase [Actinomycetota bacterium]NCV09249.1 acetylornithine/succinylornithine family transaminase [Actinomycetota bacterium]NCZ56526.1 acetylornithine/succinylornithine family transaminase [Acidimicrobiia bacterium]
MPVFGAPQVMFVRGEGTQLWDASGKRYLDFLSGISVTSLGHSHPVVADAIAEQAHTLLHVSNFFANPVATRAAVLVDELLGGGGQVFFCNSGAEANEAGIKLARKFGGRGRHKVVSMLGSFHGRTLAALAATGQPAKHEPFQPMPEGFVHVPFGDLSALSAAVDGSVAAVLVECVQGEGGVIPASNEWLQGVRALCTERGALLMVDEVQTGFARTGDWFAFQHAGVQPDVVMLAKAMGNGMPVGALWARRDIASVFKPGDHGSTYSGTALATAAVCAVIEVMREIDAPRLAREKGEYLTTQLRTMPKVHDVRGRGLLLGVEFGAAADAKAVQVELLARGLVTNAVTATALRLAPPITVTVDEIDEALSLLREVLA